MGKLINHAGERIGKLIVIRKEGNDSKGRVLWNVKCDCGNESIMIATNLRRKSNLPKSCGCAKIKHGLESNKIYYIWRGMMRRCYDTEANRYDRYGGRGIEVFSEWHDVKNFYEYVGDKPKGKQIDRINNDGNYEPGNVRWVTPSENVRNSTTVRLLEIDGVKKCVIEWSELYGVGSSLITTRIDKLGWDVKDAVMTKPNRYIHPPKQDVIREFEEARFNKSETARRLSISRGQLYKTLKHYGIR